MKYLIPSWAIHYNAFWNAIRKRNDWFIRLRYLAIVILISFLYFGEYLFRFHFTSLQFNGIFIISCAILLYNLLLHSQIKKVGDDPEGFNCLHISLLMIIIDLTALMLLVYLTGMSESPLRMLFIFHIIIGSLILPGYINYLIASIISITFVILIVFQQEGIVSYHPIIGLIGNSPLQSYLYDIKGVIELSFILFVSVYFTNKIAHQLYKQEQQLHQSLEQLSEAEKAKQKYTFSVVHEIKSPIVASKAIIDLILGNFLGPISGAIEEKLLRVQRRNEDALELINDILKYSRLKLLEISMNDQIDIEILISRLVDDHDELLKQLNITFKLDDTRKEQKPFIGNLLMLELALSNLISNAIKYSRKDGKINVTLKENKNEIELKISDNGIGIPKEELTKIFNQFYRATNVDKSSVEGSGMGLSIVKEIIERHSGSISVMSPSIIGSEKSPGTTFIIKLPLKEIS